MTSYPIEYYWFIQNGPDRMWTHTYVPKLGRIGCSSFALIGCNLAPPILEHSHSFKSSSSYTCVSVEDISVCVCLCVCVSERGVLQIQQEMWDEIRHVLEEKLEARRRERERERDCSRFIAVLMRVRGEMGEKMKERERERERETACVL